MRSLRWTLRWTSLAWLPVECLPLASRTPSPSLRCNTPSPSPVLLQALSHLLVLEAVGEGSFDAALVLTDAARVPAPALAALDAAALAHAGAWDLTRFDCPLECGSGPAPFVTSTQVLLPPSPSTLTSTHPFTFCAPQYISNYSAPSLLPAMPSVVAEQRPCSTPRCHWPSPWPSSLSLPPSACSVYRLQSRACSLSRRKLTPGFARTCKQQKTNLIFFL
jgi:hypothetical protein